MPSAKPILRAMDQAVRDAEERATVDRHLDHAGKWLRDKAESYSRDARGLAEEGDKTMAVAYKTIADELRRCATSLARNPPPNPLAEIFADVIAKGMSAAQFVKDGGYYRTTVPPEQMIHGVAAALAEVIPMRRP